MRSGDLEPVQSLAQKRAPNQMYAFCISFRRFPFYQLTNFSTMKSEGLEPVQSLVHERASNHM